MRGEMMVRKRWILPFAFQELVELVTGTRDEEDQLTLVLASPAHGMETGVAKGVEETGILVLCVLGIF